MISIIYLVELIDKECKPVAQDDAAAAEWYNLKEIMSKPELFAFDHHDILNEMIISKKLF